MSHGALSCSFCGKGQQDVRKLVAGPNVYICDECIGLCNDMLADVEVPDSPGAGDVGAAAALLARVCESDARVPRIVVEIAIALEASLRKHLNPGEG